MISWPKDLPCYVCGNSGTIDDLGFLAVPLGLMYMVFIVKIELCKLFFF